jgi:hypothetical protein
VRRRREPLGIDAPIAPDWSRSVTSVPPRLSDWLLRSVEEEAASQPHARLCSRPAARRTLRERHLGDVVVLRPVTPFAGLARRRPLLWNPFRDDLAPAQQCPEEVACMYADRPLPSSLIPAIAGWGLIPFVPGSARSEVPLRCQAHIDCLEAAGSTRTSADTSSCRWTGTVAWTLISARARRSTHRSCRQAVIPLSCALRTRLARWARRGSASRCCHQAPFGAGAGLARCSTGGRSGTCGRSAHTHPRANVTGPAACPAAAQRGIVPAAGITKRHPTARAAG